MLTYITDPVKPVTGAFSMTVWTAQSQKIHSFQIRSRLFVVVVVVEQHKLGKHQLGTNPEMEISRRWTTEANDILHSLRVAFIRRLWHDGRSWIEPMDVGQNKIFKVIACRSIIRGVRNNICAELLFQERIWVSLLRLQVHRYLTDVQFMSTYSSMKVWIQSDNIWISFFLFSRLQFNSVSLTGEMSKLADWSHGVWL